jgi:outer membrane lipoprotein-sorting protein
MVAAYAETDAYRTETEASEYRDGRFTGTQRFLYTFKKPDHIRMDMKSPHPDWVLIYPDKDGKVLVKPSGWAGFLKFHLSLDGTFLKTARGKGKIRQTSVFLSVI